MYNSTTNAFLSYHRADRRSRQRNTIAPFVFSHFTVWHNRHNRVWNISGYKRRPWIYHKASTDTITITQSSWYHTRRFTSHTRRATSHFKNSWRTTCTCCNLLGVTQKNVLLETILSRCESIILKTAPVDVGAFHSITPAFIDELVVASSGNRLSMLSLPCKTKEDSRIFYPKRSYFFRKSYYKIQRKALIKLEQFLHAL